MDAIQFSTKQAFSQNNSQGDGRSNRSRTISLEWLVFWISLVMVILISFFVVVRESGPFARSFEFNGVVRSVDGTIITMEGNYIIEDFDDSLNVAYITLVRVAITPKTEFIKQKVYLPTEEEVEEMGLGGLYRVADLRKENVEGSFVDVAIVNAGLVVRSSRNILGYRRFDASAVEYIEAIDPL